MATMARSDVEAASQSMDMPYELYPAPVLQFKRLPREHNLAG